MNALEWGQTRKPELSCPNALIWRKSLGPDATQADAWRLCDRGDWLIWQWQHLPSAIRRETEPALRRAIVRIVSRAIRRGQRALRGVRAQWATDWRRWARRWLSGKDRSATVARAAARTAHTAAEAAAQTARTAEAAEASAWAETAASAAKAAAWTAEAAEETAWAWAASEAKTAAAAAEAARTAWAAAGAEAKTAAAAAEAARTAAAEEAAEAWARSAAEAARTAAAEAKTVARAAARTVEHRLQARNIRAEIPVWPGKQRRNDD